MMFISMPSFSFQLFLGGVERSKIKNSVIDKTFLKTLVENNEIHIISFMMILVFQKKNHY